MPTGSLESLADAIQCLDRAMENERGLRLFFPTRAKAFTYRMRLYQARFKDKENNRQVYEPGDELWNKSVYDGLTITGPEQVAERRWFIDILKLVPNPEGGYFPLGLDSLEDL